MITIHNFNYAAVLTCFNAEETVARAIASIQGQTLPASEIIIIDDASSDTTFQIAKAYADQDSRITLILNETNLGQSRNRNLGGNLSRADFIVFFDDDDYSHPERVREHAKMFSKGASLSFVSSKIVYSNAYEVLAENSDFFGALDVTNFTRKLLLGQSEFDDCKLLVPASTLAVHSESFKQCNGFDSKLRRLEDVDFAIRCCSMNQSFAFSRNVLVSRYSTYSSDKGLGLDMRYEEMLLLRYERYLTENSFSFAIKHCRTRRLYFSKQYFSLFLHLVSHPYYSVKLLVNRPKALNRLTHDFKRLAKS